MIILANDEDNEKYFIFLDELDFGIIL